MELTKAICSTLIHSLWEGLILAIVTAVTIVLTRKSSADLRYKLLTAYLLLFTVGILITFCLELTGNGYTEPSFPGRTGAIVELKMFAENSALISKHDNIFSACYHYLNARSSTVVLIWFLVMWVKYMRFAAGLYHVYCLKRRQLLPAGNYWEEKIRQLSESLNIKNKVRIVQSSLAKVPITLGHLKPLILIPVGLLTSLSAAEVEAILLHELSHIRRKDYLVNILQTVLEIIFFFNPAVLWLSALIKAERENCCDDMVLGRTSDKATYIQALLSCQEYNATNHALAMGLSGKKSSLIGRVKRIVSNNNQTLNVMEKGFLTFSIVTAMLITLTVSSTDGNTVKKAITATRKVLASPFEEGVIKPVAEIRTVAARKIRPADTVKTTRKRITAEENGKRYEFELVNGKVTDLYVDGKKIEAAGIAEYQPAIDGLLARAKDAEFRAAEAGIRAKQADIRSKDAEKRAGEGDLRAKEADARAEEAAIRAKEAGVRAGQADIRAKEAAVRAMEADARAAQAKVRAKEAGVRAEMAQIEATNLQNGISAVLIDAGVIKNNAELNVKLSADELIVNGEKQPEELHKKLSDKYITRKGMVINVVSDPSRQ